MPSNAATLLAEALKLTEKERAALATQLLRSLSADDCELTDDELEAELNERMEEFERDPTTGIPWSSLREQLG
jgi:putative addiction module component (TIGR02574 family)